MAITNRDAPSYRIRSKQKKGACHQFSIQLEVTNCDFKFRNSSRESWNMKSAGNLSLFRLTA